MDKGSLDRACAFDAVPRPRLRPPHAPTQQQRCRNTSSAAAPWHTPVSTQVQAHARAAHAREHARTVVVAVWASAVVRHMADQAD
eukprot:15484635-Alexandrium_andersonii.AAC.1